MFLACLAQLHALLTILHCMIPLLRAEGCWDMACLIVLRGVARQKYQSLAIRGGEELLSTIQKHCNDMFLW